MSIDFRRLWAVTSGVLKRVCDKAYSSNSLNWTCDSIAISKIYRNFQYLIRKQYLWQEISWSAILRSHYLLRAWSLNRNFEIKLVVKEHSIRLADDYFWSLFFCDGDRYHLVVVYKYFFKRRFLIKVSQNITLNRIFSITIITNKFKTKRN